jgi:hypothetical protein
MSDEADEVVSSLRDPMRFPREYAERMSKLIAEFSHFSPMLNSGSDSPWTFQEREELSNRWWALESALSKLRVEVEFIGLSRSAVGLIAEAGAAMRELAPHSLSQSDLEVGVRTVKGFLEDARTELLVARTSPDALRSLTITVDAGSAPPEEIAEILSDLSILYRRMGGSGINYKSQYVHVLASLDT